MEAMSVQLRLVAPITALALLILAGFAVVPQSVLPSRAMSLHAGHIVANRTDCKTTVHSVLPGRASIVCKG